MRGEACWTAERIDLLKKLWAAGETAAAIAARLGGMSRSAVLGKVFRLRLPAGKTAIAAQAEHKSPADSEPDGGEMPARRRRARRGARHANRSQFSQPRRSQHKTLLELTNHSCRWPHGRPGTEKFFFCGAPDADLEHGIPYCARHMRMAYPDTFTVKNTAAAAANAARQHRK